MPETPDITPQLTGLSPSWLSVNFACPKPLSDSHDFSALAVALGKPYNRLILSYFRVWHEPALTYLLNYLRALGRVSFFCPHPVLNRLLGDRHQRLLRLPQ